MPDANASSEEDRSEQKSEAGMSEQDMRTIIEQLKNERAADRKKFEDYREKAEERIRALRSRLETAQSSGSSLADRLALRNLTFFRLGEEFRYEEYDPDGDMGQGESETGEHEGGMNEGGRDAILPRKSALKKRTESTEESGSKRLKVHWGPTTMLDEDDYT